MSVIDDNPLGAYLKDRRGKLDPSSFGFPPARRRTPGLRREEVAHLANVSATWYTWLEQGRGGAPSADLLDRIARAMRLTPVEREYLFLLAFRRPPEIPLESPEHVVTPRLQKVLDALGQSPALVKTPAWDIVAWNLAASAVMTDYARLPPDRRNVLRIYFCDPEVRARLPHWEADARSLVAVFRADLARAGGSSRMEGLVAELCRESPEFRSIWDDRNVQSSGEGTKLIQHPAEGAIRLDYSAFSVDGQPHLSMIVYTPVAPADEARVAALIRAMKERPQGPPAG